MSHDLAPYGFQILRTLGQGCEGTVYEALRDGRHYVVKMFRDLSGSEADVEAYCERVRTREAGLFPVSLICDGGRIAALYYDYVTLFRIPRIAYRRSHGLRQAILSQYCFTQAYLMSRHAMEMVDGAQFLMARDGQLHYVDYGSTIVRADNGWCRARGYTVFSLLNVLFDESGIDLDPSVRQPGFDYGRPCTFVQPGQYEALMRRYPWTGPIVDRIRQADAEIFLDPELYAGIANTYGRVVPIARRLLVADKLGHAIGRLR